MKKLWRTFMRIAGGSTPDVESGAVCDGPSGRFSRRKNGDSVIENGRAGAAALSGAAGRADGARATTAVGGA